MELTARALDVIRRSYEAEAASKRKSVEDEKQVDECVVRCMPIVNECFPWLTKVITERVLLPSNPFTEAANYALDREASLRVFREYPNSMADVAKPVPRLWKEHFATDPMRSDLDRIVKNAVS